MPAPDPWMRAIRRLLPFTTAAAVLAIAYVIWVFAARWNESRRFERASEAQNCTPVETAAQGTRGNRGLVAAGEILPGDHVSHRFQARDVG